MLISMGKKLLLCLIIFVLEPGHCEIFSAIDELQKLAVNEKILINELRSFALEVNDEYVNRKLKSFEDEHALVEQDVMKYITNPLNAYLMIKRATSDIQLIAKRFPEASKQLMEKIKIIQPEPDDLTGAVEGLLRAQFIYKLKSADFAKGVIDEIKTRKAMSPHDLYVIGLEAFKFSQEDYFTKEYLHMAWDQVKQGLDPDEEVEEVVLLGNLVTSYKRTGDYTKALMFMKKLMKKGQIMEELEPIVASLKKSHEQFGDSKKEERNPFSDNFVKNGYYSEEKEEILYSQVCRGNVTKSPKELSKLHCRYISNSPFSKLAPFKIEEANLEPYLILFVDVLSEYEMEFLKNASKPKVERAKTLTPSLEGQKSSLRVAQNSWHYDTDHELIRKLTLRIEDMTGLTQKTAEAIQVQNYGIGGHYVPHWDHRIQRQTCFEGAGNRIATVLFYLSDVEKGGATIFPFTKTIIPPRKGSAAFWHNLKVSGQGDYFTRHAACPVLLGNKWVANKWIREHGQEFRRPCLPEKFEVEPEEFYYQKFF